MIDGVQQRHYADYNFFFLQLWQSLFFFFVLQPCLVHSEDVNAPVQNYKCRVVIFKHFW